MRQERLLDLALAVAGDDAQALAKKVDGTDEADEQRVVAEIAYKGAIRNKESRAGVVAGVILAAQPQVSQTICKWAEMKGLPIVEGAEDEDHPPPDPALPPYVASSKGTTLLFGAGQRNGARAGNTRPIRPLGGDRPTPTPVALPVQEGGERR